MTIQRARSRLKTAPSRHTSRSITLPSLKPLRGYFRHLPLLILAAPFYAGLYWLLTNVRPDQVKNWLLPNSYLPFHVLFFLGNFFFFTFLTLSKRWGIFIALALEWLIFLKFQDVTWDIWALGSALLLGAGGYLLRSIWKNKFANL
jgi:hypothetical protein